MIGRLALRSLTAHPIRSAVLAAGFGAGVAVMAILLGVAEVVLQQAQAPALVGGGDVLIRLGPQTPARLVLSGTLQADALRDRIRVAAPFHATDLFLLLDDPSAIVPDTEPTGAPARERPVEDPVTGERPHVPDTTESTRTESPAPDATRPARDAGDGAGAATALQRRGARSIRVTARAGIPSLERALGDEETSGIDAWRDSAADLAWTHGTPDEVLRHIDRFHPIPDAPRWEHSWAEWLYFNGRGPDARFYLTFQVGPRTATGAGLPVCACNSIAMDAFTRSERLRSSPTKKWREPPISLSVAAPSASSACSTAFTSISRTPVATESRAI
jgi:hypothetical protein